MNKFDNLEYCKPQLRDMTETEMRNNGGTGVPVVAGVLVAVLLVAGGYTVVVAGITAGILAVATKNVSINN